MKRVAVLLVLLATTGASMKLQNYHTPIAKAMSLCHGALGSVHFEGGQAMIFASPGVDESLSTGNTMGAQGITFTKKSTHASALFQVFPKTREVIAKNMKVRLPNRFVCILPD